MSKTRKVLVVEDVETCASTIEMALAGLPGLTVEWVATAEAGLELVKLGDVDAVVTDVELPGMSGLEVLAEVQNLPVIVISATTDPTAATRALVSGASAFFPKPFSPSVIRRKIEELLYEGGS